MSVAIIIALVACQDNSLVGKSTHMKPEIMGADSVLPIAKRYQMLNDSVLVWRSNLKKEYLAATDKVRTLAKAKALFITLLDSHYYNYWQGTQWDFYGTTQTPQVGKIACGYFVTTVLRDMGVKLNRVALAETYSEKLIKTLVQPKHIKKYVPFNLPNFVAEKQKESDNVYVLGLDNHVGLLIVKNHQAWFLHSSVLAPGAVVKELAAESLALQMNYYTVAGNLTSDQLFLENWILLNH